MYINPDLLDAPLESGPDGDVGRDEVGGGHAAQVHVLQDKKIAHYNSKEDYTDKNPSIHPL